METQNIEALYIDQLIDQIEYQMDLTCSSRLKTVFIGGGTPSSLSLYALGRLFAYLSQKIDDKTEEVTIECNPEDISIDFIELLKNSPVDRISLGIQSFNEKVLQESGRRTSVKDINQALKLIDKNWDRRFSIDLISGLPAQTAAGQLKDITRAVSCGIDHISCYSLILEENTPVSNHPLLPGPEEEDSQWRICRDYLISRGFLHYEVSNFAKKGFESVHNLQYWRMKEYLGCGPGAVGMFRDDDIVRVVNPRNLNKWLQGRDVNWGADIEEVGNSDFLFENYMMGLRTGEGINRREFKKRFSFFPEALIEKTVEQSPEGTFIINKDSLSLSDESRLFMNPILIKISEELSERVFDFNIDWP